jgi:lipopolysaccharide export system protein LptA
MRRTRWLFPAAILCILIFVGATYLKRKETLAKDAPAPPKPLEAGVDARSQYWTYGDSTGTKSKYLVRARSMRQIKSPSLIELEDVELKLFHKDGAQFDLVRSAKAQFDLSAKTLFSEGEVEITMGVPESGAPPGRLVKIRSSGVTIQSENGTVATDRSTAFEFSEGGGSAMGADYDPQSRELHLRSQVMLDWRGKNAGFVPMHIEAGEAYYKERESKVWLLPWSKLTRDTLHLSAETSVVTLDNGEIRTAEMKSGLGVKDDPERKVEFGADQLILHFADGMQVNRIEGDRNGRLVSASQTMRTSVSANRLDLDFIATEKESTLSVATATGSGVVEAEPLARPGTELADTRTLRSDIIHLKMKTGGREIDSVETDGPGTVDFLPNRPGQPKRSMKGDRVWIAYGPDNRIQGVRSVNASTRTEKPSQPPAITESGELAATFDPRTSDLARLEQKVNFRYEEGVRRARADRATLEQPRDVMTLDGAARIWDPTGSASADRIVMNQRSGDFTAEGRVTSTRLPDQKGMTAAMLSNTEPLQARAQRMVSTESNTKIHYEGSAVAWQGANRIQADRLDIDRDTQVLEAHGKVISQFLDKGPKSAAKPIFTIVRAPDLVYKDETRLAVYTGGAELKRPDLSVTGQEIRAFLKASGDDSSLDKAFADGTVKIVSASEKQRRTRIGTSESAEYYADEGKVILQKGEPLLVDSVKGQTRGRQLTWWANDDRLLIDGVDQSSPARSTIRKK